MRLLRFVCLLAASCTLAASCFGTVSGKVFITGKCDVPAANFTVKFTPPTNLRQQVVVTATLSNGSYRVELGERGDYYVEVFEGARRVFANVVNIADGNRLDIPLQAAEPNAMNCPSEQPSNVSHSDSNLVDVKWSFSPPWDIDVEVLNKSPYSISLKTQSVVSTRAKPLFVSVAHLHVYDGKHMRSIECDTFPNPSNSFVMPAKQSRRWTFECLTGLSYKDRRKVKLDDIVMNGRLKLDFFAPDGEFKAFPVVASPL